MASPTDQDHDDKPLDPAPERVRRKLVRFMAINLGLLFVALMAVVGAIVYKWEPAGGREAALRTPAQGEALTGEIPLPAGARVLSHSLSGDRLSLHVDDDGGAGSIILFDISEGRIVGRFELRGE